MRRKNHFALSRSDVSRFQIILSLSLVGCNSGVVKLRMVNVCIMKWEICSFELETFSFQNQRIDFPATWWTQLGRWPFWRFAFDSSAGETIKNLSGADANECKWELLSIWLETKWLTHWIATGHLHLRPSFLECSCARLNLRLFRFIDCDECTWWWLEL